MPRLKNKVPSYRLHKATGQAIVTLNVGPVGSGRLIRHPEWPQWTVNV